MTGEEQRLTRHVQGTYRRPYWCDDVGEATGMSSVNPKIDRQNVPLVSINEAAGETSLNPPPLTGSEMYR